MAKKKKELSSADEDKLLTKLRADFEYDSTEWQPIRAAADEDMFFVSGDPWPEKDKRLREDAMRPVIVNDELHQFYNQSINDTRMHPRAVHFSPTGFGTNDKRAQFYNDKWREIEYRSNAARHYIGALENQIYRSYGWTRVTQKYESARSTNLDLWVEGLPNPNVVIPSADSLEPDSSDAKRLWVYQTIDKDEFIRRFPKATITEFGFDVQRLHPKWVKDNNRIQIAEAWQVEAVAKKLLVLQREAALKLLKPEVLQDGDHEIHQHLMQSAGPIGVFADELKAFPHDDDILDIRDVDDQKVVQYLTNGLEILETKPWKGKHIPFASCFGKVLYLDDAGVMKRLILSMTRLARQPYMAMCYLAACKLELIGMMPKFPYFVAKGTLTPKMWQLLQKSLHEPVAGIEYDEFPAGRPDGAGPAPAPIRQPYEPPLQAIEIAYESSRRSVQAAMGISPLPTPAQRNNEKSGAALGRIESSGQKGSFHFQDNYNAMIRRIGVIGEDLMTPTYDTMRTTGVRDALGNASQITINDPSDPAGVTTKGTYQVTVSSAPAEASAREAAADFMQALVQSPAAMQAAGPHAAQIIALSIRIMNLGLIGDGVADLLDPKPNAEETPQMLHAKLGQAAQQIQAMQAKLQELLQEQQADTVKVKGRLIEKQMDSANTLALKRMDDATKITVAMIGAKTKTDISANESRDEALALNIQVAHEERMAEHEGQTTAVQSGLDHAHELRQALLDHHHEMQQASLEHRQTLEQLAASAVLQPPTDGAGGDSSQGT